MANRNRDDVVVISKDMILERLAEIDAILDIMAEHDEMELTAEREHLFWLLHE